MRYMLSLFYFTNESIEGQKVKQPVQGHRAVMGWR